MNAESEDGDTVGVSMQRGPAKNKLSENGINNSWARWMTKQEKGMQCFRVPFISSSHDVD